MDVETPKVLEVADGVWVRQEIDNIGWVDMGDGLLIVDALEHKEKEDDVIQAMQDTAGDKPLKYLLNTHTHYDHIALNDVFHDRGAEVINAHLKDIPQDGLTIEGPQRSAKMIPFPGCHTTEDCVVWIPESKVLFMGDLFGWGLIPLTRNMRTEEFSLLVSTYERLIDYGADVVVAGHGPLLDNNVLRRYVDYIHWLRTECRRRVESDQSDRQILKEIKPPEDMEDWWRFTSWKHEDSVAKMLKSVRRDWV
ncbi:MAG: MBL fold metallo-hydrolase [Phycisphaerae bacterium]